MSELHLSDVVLVAYVYGAIELYIVLLARIRVDSKSDIWSLPEVVVVTIWGLPSPACLLPSGHWR